MTVNDMVKTFGYTRNRLTHFTISLYDAAEAYWISIKHPNADEYVYLCDRIVTDWMVDCDGDNEEVDITVKMKSQDYILFKEYMKGV